VVDADEVTPVATDHGAPRFVGPLVEDLLAHLAQLGRMGSCEQHWRFRWPLALGERADVRSQGQSIPLYDVIAGTAMSAHTLIGATWSGPSMGTDSSTDG